MPMVQPSWHSCVLVSSGVVSATIHDTGVCRHSSGLTGNTFRAFTLALKHVTLHRTAVCCHLKVHGLQTLGCRWIFSVCMFLWVYVKGWCFSSQSQISDPKNIEPFLPQRPLMLLSSPLEYLLSFHLLFLTLFQYLLGDILWCTH